MAQLTPEQIDELWQDFMKMLKDINEPVNVTKQDLKTALTGLDQAFSDNAATINSWIPNPVRSEFSIKQKAAMVEVVAAKRRMTGTA